MFEDMFTEHLKSCLLSMDQIIVLRLKLDQNSKLVSFSQSQFKMVQSIVEYI